ncbi:AAA+-type ATPase [Steccherinum ochraceum]|uniref:AAA+-type ATPase n=1 Tax=Steccherinum ochraceum TaxID=92696 RepID=A0A4R0RL81_9APHY|nr:AAA+-type ATPase [Steccherinum ochraceum]
MSIAWPSQEISQDTIFISSPLALTAGLLESDKVRVTPLGTGRPAAGLPSLKQAQEARTIHVREIPFLQDSGESTATSVTVDGEKGKRRDWLPLLVREALVHLKYLTNTQTLDVTYEGVSRRFKVVSVSGTRHIGSDPTDQLTENFEKLDINRSSDLWTVGWGATVAIVDSQKIADDINTNIQNSDTSIIARSAGADAYASVGGLDKQIAQVRDLIEIPLTRPELFRHFGLKPPRGILLHGPPGTGKTHLARAIAASTQSSVLIINGPELSSAYHGETESKLRDVFAEAQAKSPCIVVLDEVDALCPRREDGPGGEVEKRVVAQLLTIMDGMEDENTEGGKDRVVVVATTNRPNAIDPALRRPGRFDREIEIGIPDAEARYSILNVLLRKAPHILTEDDIRSVTARAHGYVGADLSAVVREAGTSAIKRWLHGSGTGMTAQPSVSPSDSTMNQDGPDTSPKLTVQDLLASLTSVRPSALRSVFLDTVPVRYSDIGGQAETIQKLREMVEWPLLHPEAFERLGVRSPKGVLLLLNEMDGVQELLGVTVVAATNRPDVIDSALMRPGRLDRILYVGPPDQAGREEILRIRVKKMSVEPDLDISRIATLAEGCSGAEMTALCQEAALLTMKGDVNAPYVPQEAFTKAATAMKKQITPAVVAHYHKWATSQSD